MNRRFFTTILALLFAALPIKSVFAQGYYILSDHAGADSSQYHYEQGDTLHMTIYAPNLNYNQIKEMRWKIKASHMNEFYGDFTNEMNGYFRAQFTLSQLPDSGEWEWEAKLKDKMGMEVEYEARFTYMHRNGHDDDNYFEYKGTIEAIGNDSLVVDGFTFWVDSNTVVKGDDHQMLSFSDLKVGDYVEVKAVEQQDGSYLARKIKLEDSDNHHDYEMEYYGVIDSVGSDFVDVNGMRFFVTEQTEIKSEDHNYLSLDDLEKGLYVKVEAVKQTDGTYWAKEIKVKSYYGDDDDNEMEFKGFIDSLGTDYLIVNGMRFNTDSKTKVFLDDHRPGSLSDLSVGQFVEVKAFLQTDGSYLARKIDIEDDYANSKIHFTGIIDSVGSDFIIVFGYTVYVDDNTEIFGHKHTPLTLSDLEKGQRVKVKGYFQNDGSILATSIKVKPFFQDYVEFYGIVDSVGMDWISVNQVTFLVDSNTVIFDQNKNLILLSDVKVGDFVEIKAQHLADGSWLAHRIKVEDDKIGRIEISAYIDSIGDNFLIAGGITFYVDDSTRILDYTGNPIMLGDLSAGQYVEIKAYMQTDGTYLAVRIKLEDSPNMTVYGATLNGLSSDRVIVGGQEVNITTTTVVLDESYQPTDLSAYTVGSEVTIWAEQDGSGSQAVQIKLGTTSALTSLDGEVLSTLPEGFELRQNFPNPFNPITTIPFRISGSKFGQVKLEVYNILGQKVKTLFNGVLGAGNYTFQWNATNDFGQTVSSGMYFYKLDMAGRSQVKQMILIR